MYLVIRITSGFVVYRGNDPKAARKAAQGDQWARIYLDGKLCDKRTCKPV